MWGKDAGEDAERRRRHPSRIPHSAALHQASLIVDAAPAPAHALCVTQRWATPGRGRVALSESDHAPGLTAPPCSQLCPSARPESRGQRLLNSVSSIALSSDHVTHNSCHSSTALFWSLSTVSTVGRVRYTRPAHHCVNSISICGAEAFCFTLWRLLTGVQFTRGAARVTAHCR